MTTLAEVLEAHAAMSAAAVHPWSVRDRARSDFQRLAASFVIANRDALARFELERAARAAIGEDHPVRILTGSGAPEFVSRFTAAVHTSYIIVGADWKPEE